MKISPLRVIALLFVGFFTLFGVLAALNVIAMTKQVGLHPYALTSASWSALNLAMAYGIFKNRRWVLLVLALNLAFLLERAIGGGFSVFNFSGTVATLAAIGLTAARRREASGLLWHPGPIALFIAAQTLPYVVASPVVN